MPVEQLESFYRHRSYVHCRTFGHSWDEIPVTESHPDGHSFWLRCVSCGMVRRDVFDRRYGDLLHRQYDQPPDYSLAGLEVPTRSEFRLKLFDLANSLAERRENKRKATAS